MQDLLTEREVADMLRLSRQTLSRWRSCDQGPPFVQIGGTIRYSRESLERWIQDNTAGGAQPA
jgi:predicted DNA-binding transcriptional regulator AlpA